MAKDHVTGGVKGLNSISIDKQNLDMNDISASWGEMGDQPGQEASDLKIIVNSNQKYQEIDGFGGAFNELGRHALLSLDDHTRHEVMHNLFDKEEGAGFSFCRFPIGASDFVLDAYSLDDHEGDFLMEKFSIQRDMHYLIPYIKSALDINPELRLHASPWSPPGWMKTNNSMEDGHSLIDSEDIYKAYALYFCKFVEAYSRQGIPVNRIFIQNEPDAWSNFPCCIMEEEQMVKFTADYLLPAFKAHGIETEIWGGTFRTITGLQACSCMRDRRFRAAVEGVGLQYCINQYVYDIQKVCGDKRIMHTESVCYNGKNSWEQAIKLFFDFIGYINAGSVNYTYWNMVLDHKGAGPWGWKQNSLISIQTDEGKVAYNPDYHVMKLISSNVRPGARRIESFCFSKRTVAFENPNGDIIVLVSNLNNRIETGYTLCNGKSLEIELPAQSISAITL